MQLSRVNQRKVYAFDRLWNKKQVASIKTEMLIFQSKANLDKKILFGKITHLKDPTIKRMSVRGLYGNRGFHVPFWYMIFVALKC